MDDLFFLLILAAVALPCFRMYCEPNARGCIAQICDIFILKFSSLFNRAEPKCKQTSAGNTIHRSDKSSQQFIRLFNKHTNALMQKVWQIEIFIFNSFYFLHYFPIFLKF